MTVPDEFFTPPTGRRGCRQEEAIAPEAAATTGRPSPETPALMSGHSPVEAAAAPSYPGPFGGGASAAAAVRWQHSMMQPSEFAPTGTGTTANANTNAHHHARQHQQHQPNAGPWPKHGGAAASEAFHHHQPLHYNPPQSPPPSDRNVRHARPGNLKFQFDRMRPSSPSNSARQMFSGRPINTNIPLSPRWDSMPQSPHSTSTSPGGYRSVNNSSSRHSPQRNRAESTPTPRTPRSIFPGLSSNPFIPETSEPEGPRNEIRQFPLLGRQNGAAQHQPVAATPDAEIVEPPVDSRQTTPTEANMPIENFSRPRKPSVRSLHPEISLIRSVPDPVPERATTPQLQYNYGAAPNPWPRSRRLSASSSQSSGTFTSSIPARPSNDHLRASSRAESVRRPIAPTSGPTSAPARQPPAYLNSATLPPSRELPPWVTGGDELRSSYRSQLTASTAQTALFTATGTERSSVMTRNSSITEHSIINGYARTSWRTNSIADDGPTLEDMVGLYERGFTDSDMDIESIRRSMRFADADEGDVFALEGSRPPSEHSNMSGVGAKMLEAMNDELPKPGAQQIPQSDRAVARESVISYRKSGLLNSLPKDLGFGLAAEHYAKRHELDVRTLGKHDSAKSLDGSEDITKPRESESRPTSPKTPTAPTMPVAARSPSPPANEIGEAPLSRSSTPSAPVQYPVEPPEEPGSRDRYGFKKASANITRQQYDAWDASYSEYLARRRKKWVAYLKDNSLMTDHPNRFPPRNAKTKRFIRKGIPPDWRGAAWFYYAGGPAILGKHRGVYDDLLRRAGLDPNSPGVLPDASSQVKPLIAEDIEKDLHRTFPDNIRFKPPRSAAPPTSSWNDQKSNDDSEPSTPTGVPPVSETAEPKIIASLRRVLHAFALYNPRIGYCQSLNFLAGMLLLFVETEEQAFWLLNIITRVYLPGTHEMSLEGSKVDLGVLMVALKDSLPNVWKQIGGDEIEGGGHSKRLRMRLGKDGSNRSNSQGPQDPNRLPAITLCMTAWFMSCFIGTLPVETVLRVWDVFFYEGSRTLFRIALTIFKLGESEIKAVADPMEMFGVVQAFPRRLLDCNALMEACYKRRNGIGHLSQEAVEERRQERREGIRRWRAQQEAAAHAESRRAAEIAAAGLDLATDYDDVRRKGTLFSRRKDQKDREQVRADQVM